MSARDTPKSRGLYPPPRRGEQASLGCLPAANVSEATVYAWNRKYAHLRVSELRRLRQLADEHARLKSFVAHLTLDKHMTAEALPKTRLRPAPRRTLAGRFQRAFEVSSVRASQLAQLSRAVCNRRCPARDPSALRLRIRAFSHATPRSRSLRLKAGDSTAISAGHTARSAT
jgi:hypothetical protein